MAKEQSKKTTEVAAKEETLPQTAGLNMEDLAGMQGLGLENVEGADIVFPFINIIQSGSPQRKKGKDGYIEGAEEGMMYNTTTKKLYDPNLGVKVVPLYHEKRLIERSIKKEGEQQKFITDHKQNQSVIEGLDKIDNWTYLTRKGTHIIPTDYIYFLILNAETQETEFAVVSFKSTLARQAREIVSQARMRSITLPNGKKWSPPLFFKTLVLKTAMKSGNENDWFVYSVSPSDDLVKFDSKGQVVDNIEGGAVIFEDAYKLCKDVLKAGVHVVDSSQDGVDDSSTEKSSF